jgi:hypothetical protein
MLNVLLIMIEVLLMFLSKSSGFPSLLPSLPHRVVQRVGKKWIFSSSRRSFGYGYEAVSIRVNTYILLYILKY